MAGQTGEGTSPAVSAAPALRRRVHPRDLCSPFRHPPALRGL